MSLLRAPGAMPLRGALVLLSLALSSCSGFAFFPDRPKLAIEAIGAMMTPDGTASMHSPSGLGPVPQPEVGLVEGLNLTDRQFGYGANLSYGDNFAGLELGFFQWEHGNVSTVGTLPNDFGNLDQGDSVQSTGDWKLWRLSYRLPILEHSIDLKSRTELDLRFAAGLAIHHNEFRTNSEATNANRSQTLKMKDDMGFPMLTTRFEAEVRPFTLRLDAAAVDGNFDDIDGLVVDTSISLHYRIQSGVSAWAGLWRYDLPAKGVENGLPYEFDLEMSGFMFGLRWEF